MGMFLGWMPDAATLAALGDLQGRVRAALPAHAAHHAWRLPAQLHMTLRYLGDGVDSGALARLQSALDAFGARRAPKAADAALDGARYWAHARVLVGHVEPSPGLQCLLQALEALARASGFAAQRAQRAHITLAYLPRGSAPPALQLPPLAAHPFRVARIDLLQTIPDGYRKLRAWPLATPD